MSPVARSRVVRFLLASLGMASLAAAVAGIVLPLVPTVDLVLVAAFLFSRSSPRFDAWLAENRFFGEIVRDWRSGAGFTRRSKAAATVGITLTFGISIVVGNHPAVLDAALVLMAVGIVWHVLSRPTKRPTVDAVRS